MFYWLTADIPLIYRQFYKWIFVQLHHLNVDQLLDITRMTHYFDMNKLLIGCGIMDKIQMNYTIIINLCESIDKKDIIHVSATSS